MCDIDDGDIAYTIVLSQATSSDSVYNGLNPADVSLTNLDNDARPLYLPIVVKNLVSAPDLVIDSLSASSSGITMVIRNQANVAATNPFWVDVYFNPSQTPTVNKIWQSIAPAGAAWGVTQCLNPGTSLTLTYGGTYFAGSESSSLPLPVGAAVYALVDSVDFSTSYGAVLESSEGNNLFGPTISTAASRPQHTGLIESPFSAGLPSRE